MNKLSSLLPWLMLVSRSLLFVFFQILIALISWLAGYPEYWNESARWWVMVVILTNIVSIFLLVWCFRLEGKRFFDIFRFSQSTVKTDLLWFFGSSLIGVPIAAAPMGNLAAVLFGDSMTPINMMFQPLPGWALVVGFLFPLTIAFSELPTYFGYAMPRLAVQLKNGWLAWLLSSFFLAAQHIFLPFIPDGRFILWRLGMYLPFALFAGLLLKLRPQLLPYFVIVHALIDISTLSVYWMV
jgi:membrane protease YdiL (CAAX protease family)